MAKTPNTKSKECADKVLPAATEPKWRSNIFFCNAYHNMTKTVFKERRTASDLGLDQLGRLMSRSHHDAKIRD